MPAVPPCLSRTTASCRAPWRSWVSSASRQGFVIRAMPFARAPGSSFANFRGHADRRPRSVSPCRGTGSGRWSVPALITSGGAVDFEHGDLATREQVRSTCRVGEVPSRSGVARFFLASMQNCWRSCTMMRTSGGHDARMPAARGRPDAPPSVRRYEALWAAVRRSNHGGCDEHRHTSG